MKSNHKQIMSRLENSTKKNRVGFEKVGLNKGRSWEKTCAGIIFLDSDPEHVFWKVRLWDHNS